MNPLTSCAYESQRMVSLPTRGEMVAARSLVQWRSVKHCSRAQVWAGIPQSVAADEPADQGWLQLTPAWWVQSDAQKEFARRLVGSVMMTT